jgi:hypothetical protein
MTFRRLIGRVPPAVGLAFVAGAFFAGCSEPGRPEDPPAGSPGRFRGTIAGEDLPNGLVSQLHVRTLAGVASVDSDGSFEVGADSTDAEQPLIATTSDGTPVFLAFARSSSSGVELGAASTIRSLLQIDPFLLGLPDSARGTVVESAQPLAAEAVGLLRNRLGQGRIRYLVDRDDLEIQRLLATALRAAGGIGNVDCPRDDGSSLNPALWPRVESGSTGTRLPVVVNPVPTHFSLSIDDYYDLARKSVVSLDSAPLVGLRRVGEPARKQIDLGSGRYHLQFSNGTQGAAGTPGSPGWAAMRADLGGMAGAMLDLLRIGSGAPWRSDPALLKPEDLQRIEAYRAALADGAPGALVIAAYDLLSRNAEVFAPGADRILVEALCSAGIAQGEASTEGYPGPFVCALAHPPVIDGGDIRVNGALVSAIDPPGLVRKPAAVDAIYLRGRIVVTWQDVATNEEAYVIERTHGAASEEIARLGEDARAFTDPSVQPATTYSYRVLALNRVARSDWSEPYPIETPAEIDTIAPGAVEDLHAESAGVGSILLSWTAPGDDDQAGTVGGYNVRVSIEPITPANWWTAAQLPNAPRPGVPGTREYLFANGLSEGVTYYFALDAYDTSNNRSRLSNVASAGTGAGASWATTFQPSPEGQGLDGSVEAFVMREGMLVAGGTFAAGGGAILNYIGQWDGTQWHPLGTGLNRWVFAMIEFNGDLYAGGLFTAAGDVETKGIARWDGTAWRPVGGGFDAGVYALAVYKGELYAAGAFQMSGDRVLHGIARWDGREWNPLGTGVNNQVFAMTEYKGDLIVGGDYLVAGGVPDTHEIARWDGSSWHPMGTGMDLDYVRALVVSGDDLYAGGQFIHAGGVVANSVARWDGQSWHALDDGVDRWVGALAVVDGDLIAGGSFLNASGVAAAHLARWNGSGWAPFYGGPANGEVHAILPTDAGLMIGGWFTRTGGVASSYIARWGP